jgi:hypothetical protein
VNEDRNVKIKEMIQQEMADYFKPQLNETSLKLAES